MKLIVGLGNPGPKYEITRHNAGFLLVDELADKYRVDLKGSKFNGELGKGSLFGEDALLLKPSTFMNLSGRAVAGVMNFYKIPENELIVIHDDIDLEPGKVKARVGGGHGGNNGIRSIIADIGGKDFHRIKVGVGRPKAQKDGDVSNWVLNRLSDAELLSLQQEVLDQVLLRLEQIFQAGRK